MPYVHLMVVLALAEFVVFGFAVGRARVRYQVAAPATGGHEVFERYYRVQMNTLEQLVVFVPAIMLFGRYLSAPTAAALGALFIVGRALYFRGYVRSPQRRHFGFGLSFFPNMVLLGGALVGALRALLSS